jgi:hypothetical protein
LPPDGLTAVALLVLAERIRDDAATTVRYLLDQGVVGASSPTSSASLFVTKTVYAAVLAIAVGLAGVPFP